MSSLIVVIISFFAGIFASMGLGGGMILILFLILIQNENQLTAQGINLLFFIPIAATSIIIHTKNKLIRWKKIVPAVMCGTISAIIGSFIATKIDSNTLSKVFAIFVFIVGIKELFAKTD